MSFGFTLSSSAGQQEYRVVNRNGCKLIYGAISIDDFNALAKSKSLPPGAILSHDLARACGANIAMGSKSDVNALIQLETPAAIVTARYKYFGFGRDLREEDLGVEAVRWLAVGQIGQSSLALFAMLSGWRRPFDEDLKIVLPCDPSDFGRCRLLIEEVPVMATRLKGLADDPRAMQSGWSILIGEWDDLCALHDAEAPNWRSDDGRAPKLYKRLQLLAHPKDDEREFGKEGMR
ncbi:MAG: hypothetical protein EPN79_11745 [Burkholderiaceae bacterium]|nr:MAG: hypothetical protein EPN79_11745 [Burkholderiaceae bacterium]TBR76670.1 MAG: hypothetical protein EPN64_05320 [Burkholderiaceae bacterium]